MLPQYTSFVVVTLLFLSALVLLLPLLPPGGAKSMDTMAMSEASIKRAHIGRRLDSCVTTYYTGPAAMKERWRQAAYGCLRGTAQ
jgi:hypothetical protein